MATLSITAIDAFVPRIIAAVRGTYPNETAGLADGAAVRTALIIMMKHCVAQFEATQQVNTQQNAWQTQYNTSTTDAGSNLT